MRIKTLLFAGLAAVGFTACQTDEGIDYSTPHLGGFYPIVIDGSVETRVDNTGFTDGDQVGLYGVNYTDDNATAGELLDEGNQVDNARYTYDAANNLWVSAGNVYYKDAETHIDLYAYHPYGDVESVERHYFEVHRDQSGNNSVNGFSLSDFLWGKVEDVTPSSEAVRIRYSHKLSAIQVELVEGDNFAESEWATLSKGILVTNTVRGAAINLATGAVEASGEVEKEGIVMKSEGESFRAIVVPQTVAANTALLLITIDGVPYRYELNSDFTFVAGQQSKFTLSVSKQEFTGEYSFTLTGCEIVDWISDLESHGGEARQYYAVQLDESGTLGATIRADQRDPDKIKHLKVSGPISANDFLFMRDSMEILQAVNLKETELAGAWRYYVLFEGDSDHHYEYFEGIMPETEEECRAAVQERYPDKTISYWNHREQISYPDEIPANAFSSKGSLVHFVFPERVTKIGSHAFYKTTLSDALIIPNAVTEIGDYAFAGTAISSLQLPHGLRSIGGEAFSGCSALSGGLTLPESLEHLGGACFYGCSMLSGPLTLPSKLKEIPWSCFAECSSLSGDLVIPEGVTSIGDSAFSGCSGLNGSLTLPSTLKEMHTCAFSSCQFQGELVIPAEVNAIPSSCFFGCQFSSLYLPEGLIRIGEQAFYGNSRLGEAIDFPESLTAIGNDAFRYCSTLPAIHLKSKVATIGRSAFEGCYYLSDIRCEATTPPALGSRAFDGVAKDNFTVAVPESAVVKYQTTTGWADFKRFGAAYDFSISRPLVRTLNAAYTKSYTLRVPSGEAWSIDSQPDWVTITPNSGVGKVDVTVTIDELARANAAEVTYDVWKGNRGWQTATMKGRRGEVVFKLNERDVTTSLVVEQYDSDNYDGEVIVNQTATEGNGVNIVFMGDCFDAKDIAEGGYLSAINEAIGYYFAIEPYKTYRPHFNIYTVVGMSPESGMGTVNTIKEAKFGSQYSLEGITPNTQVTYEYAMKPTTVDENNLCETLVVMVENTTDYGGICYMWGDGSAIAICPMSADAYPYDFRGIVQHEAGGHGFAKLADEYIYHNAFIQSCTCNCCSHLDGFNAGKALGWYRNLSTNGDMNTVEWSHLIFHTDYSNIVDMYEGGYFHTRGIYRSEANSCMNNNIPYYSAISRQEMVERIMSYGGLTFNIEEFYANDVRDASNNTFKLPLDNAINWSAAGRQMPPKYMGDKPKLR